MLGYRILRKPTHQARKSCGNIEEFTDKTTRNRGNQTLSPKHEVHRTTSNKNIKNEYYKMRSTVNDKSYRIPSHLRARSPQTANNSVEIQKETTNKNRGIRINKELMCLCGKHHSPTKSVKYKYPKNLGTLYQKEFQKYNSPKPVAEIYIHEKHKNHRNSHKMDCITQNQLAYKAPHKSAYLTINKRGLETTKIPFSGHTSYTNSFPNWGDHDIDIQKHPKYPIHSVPFSAKTQYSETYRKDPNHCLTPPRRGHKFLLNNNIRFVTRSSTNIEFQPKIGDRFPSYKPDREPARTFNFPGQFESRAKRDFSGQPEDLFCSARNSLTDFYNSRQPYFDPTSKKLIFH